MTGYSIGGIALGLIVGFDVLNVRVGIVGE